MQLSRTYVHGLPADVLVKILHLTDEAPRWNSTHLYLLKTSTNVWERKWESRASLFFSNNSPFQFVSPTIFKKIRLCAGHKFRLDVGEGIMELGVADPTEDKSHQFALDALRTCGSSLKSVELSHNITSNADYSRFLKLLVEHCHNVESVRLHIRKDSTMVLDDYNELLRQFGPQLHTLSWYCENGVAVERFDFSKCVALKEFTFQGENLSMLCTQLESFGSTLDKLVVCCMDTTADWRYALDKIQENCRNLTAICLEFDEVCSVVGTERYTSFLMSYGEQLVDARVEGLLPEQLFQVIMACPNLRFSLHIEGESIRWKAMNALKSHLKDIQIRLFRDDSVDLEFFEGTVTQCENLDKLSVYLYNMKITDNSDVMLKSIFSSSRHVLEEFQFHPLIVSPWSIGLIASNTSHLRVFDVESVNYIEDGNIFRGIAKSNPLLKQVKVFEKRQDNHTKRKVEDAVQIVEQLVQSFSACKNLEKLDLRIVTNETGSSTEESKKIIDNVRDQIRVICRPLRNRGIEHRIWIFQDHYPFTAVGGGEPGTN